MKVASKYVNDYLMMTTPLVGDIAYNCRVPLLPLTCEFYLRALNIYL